MTIHHHLQILSSNPDPSHMKYWRNTSISVSWRVIYSLSFMNWKIYVCEYKYHFIVSSV